MMNLMPCKDMKAFIRYNAETSKFNPQPKPEKTEKKKKSYKYKKKPTGELELFKHIWEQRGPYSQISGTYLGEFNVCYFAHIIPKAKNKFPEFKLNQDNIYLMTFDEHFMWDNRYHKCTGQEWDMIKQLKENLLLDYYELYHQK